MLPPALVSAALTLQGCCVDGLGGGQKCLRTVAAGDRDGLPRGGPLIPFAGRLPLSWLESASLDGPCVLVRG